MICCPTIGVAKQFVFDSFLVGRKRPTGYLAPYDNKVLLAEIKSAGALGRPEIKYTSGFNYFHLMLLQCSAPHVPIYMSRVLEVVRDRHKAPGKMTPDVVANITWNPEVETIPQGSVVFASPEELVHAPLVFLTDRLREGNMNDDTKKQFLRMLLSFPVELRFVEGQDAMFALSQSLRMSFKLIARAVVHTIRQIILLVAGFRKRKLRNKSLGPAVASEMSVAEICDFFKSKVENIDDPDDGTDQLKGVDSLKLTSPDTMQAILTCYDRLVCAAEVDAILARWDQLPVLANPWNNIWKLQEIAARCSKKTKMMVWLMTCLEDQLLTQSLSLDMITHPNLKSGGKNSISDPIIFGAKVKDYLLYTWLAGIQIIPADIKTKIQEIFRSVEAYRSQYKQLPKSPMVQKLGLSTMGSAPDTTWVGRNALYLDICSLIETAVYMRGENENAGYRSALRYGKSPAEVMLGWEPWKTAMAEIDEKVTVEVNVAGNGEDGADGHAGRPQAGKADGDDEQPEHGAMDIDDDDAFGDKVQFADDVAVRVAKRADQIGDKMCAWLVEPNAQGDFKELLAAEPKAMVHRVAPEASEGLQALRAQSGNQLVLVDLNSYGAPDHRPDLRICPLPQGALKKFLQPVMQNVTGMDDPKHIPKGIIFCLIDGGRTRLREFRRELPFNQPKSDKQGTRSKQYMLHFDEETEAKRKTGAARRYRKKGHCRLTQSVVMAYNKGTKWQQGVPFQNHKGTNYGDVLGPVKRPNDPGPVVESLKAKRAWLGKRFVLCGGRLDDSSSASEDSKSEGEPEPHDDDDVTVEQGPAPESTAVVSGRVPLNHHALPAEVVVDLCHAHGVRYVLDFTPNVLGLAAKLVEQSITYVGIVPTDIAKTWFDQNFKADLTNMLQDSGSKLYQRHLASANLKETEDPFEKPKHAKAKTPSCPKLKAASSTTGITKAAPKTSPPPSKANAVTPASQSSIDPAVPKPKAAQKAKAAEKEKAKAKAAEKAKANAPQASAKLKNVDLDALLAQAEEQLGVEPVDQESQADPEADALFG